MANGQYYKTATALVVANGKLLLLQRDDGKEIENPGRWQLQ